MTDLDRAWYRLDPDDDRSPAEVADADSFDVFVEQQMSTAAEIVECAWCARPALSPHSPVTAAVPEAIVVTRRRGEWACVHVACEELAFDDGWRRC